MDFKINQQERDALKGLPHLARLAYLEAIRPYMDYETGIVGLKRGISYQSLREELYVETQRGNKGGSPSREQMRRVIKTLERAGLIAIQSEGKKLILQCLLATWDFSSQNLLDRRATHQADIHPTSKSINQSSGYVSNKQKPDTVENTLPATPPESGNNNIFFIKNAFEKFWEMYPLKQSKHKAWSAFFTLSPSADLFQNILQALKKQIEHYHCAKARGQWMPNWKHPNNWLTGQCWQDTPFQTQGANHAHRQKPQPRKSNGASLLWESCKDSVEAERRAEQNVIDLQTYQHSTD